MNYQASGKQVAPMERAMGLSDEVIRYLTLKKLGYSYNSSDLKQVTALKDQLFALQKQVQSNLAAATSILAGLVLNRETIKKILRSDIMRESVIYQDILEEGREEGEEKGLQKGRQEGLREGKEEKARQIALKMLSPEYSYVKRSRRTVYCIIAEHEKGRIFDFEEPWRDMGRPQIMNDDEVDLFTESVRKNPGEKNMRECVNDMLIESARKKGRLCASDMKFNATTVNNYMALFANKGGISLTDKSIAKNNSRWTVKHSSIGMMALIIVVAGGWNPNTQYIVNISSVVD